MYVHVPEFNALTLKRFSSYVPDVPHVPVRAHLTSSRYRVPSPTVGIIGPSPSASSFQTIIAMREFVTESPSITCLRNCGRVGWSENFRLGERLVSSPRGSRNALICDVRTNPP